MNARLAALTLAALALSAGLATSAAASVPGIKGRIAFTSSRDGNAELYSVWPDGSQVRRLTWTPETEQSPAWAPDLLATKIAYESDADGRFRIHVMDWDGRNAHRVSPAGSDLDDDVDPTWSPNASRIAFASTRGGDGWHIWAMDADGTNLRRVTDGLGVDPAWSPGFGGIAYAWHESIWLVNPDGTNARRLTVPAGRPVAAPAWSPFADAVVFSRYGPNGLPGELFVASAFFPGEERQLTTGGFANARPSWSPDGSEIVFQRRVAGTTEWQLMAIRPDGTGLREVLPPGDLAPAWGSSASVPSGTAPAAPAIRIYSPDDGEEFWQGQDAPALYECLSAGSAVVSCAGDVPLGDSLDTATAGPHTFTVAAVDADGRTATETVRYRVVDTNPPRIALRTPEDGAEYELGEDVSVDYACADPAGSGIELCDGTLPSGAPLPTDTVGEHEFVVHAVDAAFNQAHVSVTYRVVDRTPPSISVSAPVEGATYTVGEAVSSSFTCDDESGVAFCKGPGTVATDEPGPNAFTVTAADQYGNVARADVPYSVVYRFDGFYAPLVGGARFRAGEAIPVKFSLGGDRGLDVLSAGSPRWRWIACGSPARDGGSFPAAGRLTYNAATGRYRYLAETDPAWAGACLELVVALRDGTSHPVVVAFDR